MTRLPVHRAGQAPKAGFWTSLWRTSRRHGYSAMETRRVRQGRKDGIAASHQADDWPQIERRRELREDAVPYSQSSKRQRSR
jgi:hypothetical protein